jgi:hypothetical protein
MVMEHVAGENLFDLVEARAKPFPPDLVLKWAGQLIEVLSYLHALSPPVIVRDIKPHNIILRQNGDVCLIDFGIAKQALPGQLTATSLKGMGSEGFAPLEQYGQSKTDQRTDIYALGATLYYLLTCDVPPDAVSRATSQATLTNLRTKNPAVGVQMAAAIEKAMALDPSVRPQSAGEFRQLLAPQGTSPLILPTHPGPTQASAGTPAGFRLLGIALVFVGIVIGVTQLRREAAVAVSPSPAADRIRLPDPATPEVSANRVTPGNTAAATATASPASGGLDLNKALAITYEPIAQRKGEFLKFEGNDAVGNVVLKLDSGELELFLCDARTYEGILISQFQPGTRVVVAYWDAEPPQVQAVWKDGPGPPLWQYLDEYVGISISFRRALDKVVMNRKDNESMLRALDSIKEIAQKAQSRLMALEVPEEARTLHAIMTRWTKESFVSASMGQEILHDEMAGKLSSDDERLGWEKTYASRVTQARIDEERELGRLLGIIAMAAKAATTATPIPEQ